MEHFGITGSGFNPSLRDLSKDKHADNTGHRREKQEWTKEAATLHPPTAGTVCECNQTNIDTVEPRRD